MTQVVEATFDGGVLRPDGPLVLREHERVRLIVQPLSNDDGAARAEAMRRLRAGIEAMDFCSDGRGYPDRDGLHERG